MREKKDTAWEKPEKVFWKITIFITKASIFTLFSQFLGKFFKILENRKFF